MTRFRPILMSYQDFPSDEYVAPFENAMTGPNGILKFYTSYEMPIEYESIERMRYFGDDYRTGIVNPYNMISAFISPQLAPEERALIILPDWVEPANYGWGGVPIALVGSYAAATLLSHGTPEASVDDFLGEGLLAHETGHTLGFGHEYNSVMYEWWLYPNVDPSPAMVQAYMKGLAAPLARLSMFVDDPCPLPPHG